MKIVGIGKGSSLLLLRLQMTKMMEQAALNESSLFLKIQTKTHKHYSYLSRISIGES
jgi:hypothetical protein